MSGERVTDRFVRVGEAVHIVRSPRWLCPVHGEIEHVFTIVSPGVIGHTYCLPCAIALLERLGLRPIDRVD